MMSNIKSMAPRIKETSRYAWKRLRNLKRKIWLYEKYNIYIENISGKKLPLNHDIIFRQGTLDDIPLVAEQFVSHFGTDGEAILSKKLADGEILIIGYMDKELQSICYISWLSKNDPYFVKAEEIKNWEKAICACKELVPEQFRKMGIGRSGKTFSHNLAFELGYHQKINFVKTRNIASIRMNESFGLKIQGQLLRIVIFNRPYLKILRKSYFKYPSKNKNDYS